MLAAAAAMTCAYAETKQTSENAPMIEASIRDTLNPIRQGGVDGRPFWNTYAKQFIYVPSFEFPKAEKAASYRFEAEDRFHHIHVFTADTMKMLSEFQEK